MSAACCRGWEPYCIHPGSRRTQLPSDSISPRPEGMEGRHDVGRGEVSPRPTPAQLFNRHAPPARLATPALVGAAGQTPFQGSATLREQAPWALPELFTWWELTGSFSASWGTRLAWQTPSRWQTEGREGAGDVPGLQCGDWTWLAPGIPCRYVVLGPEAVSAFCTEMQFLPT